MGAIIPNQSTITILLDIDGVLVTTPAWRVTEQLADGFLKFNDKAAKNLARIINETKAAIVLTTTHRINYSNEEWKVILRDRGINPSSISKLNDIATWDKMADRATEIEEWVNRQVEHENFVIIDDDLSIHGLPESIKEKCVMTRPLIGLDDEATLKALDILNNRGAND